MFRQDNANVAWPLGALPGVGPLGASLPAALPLERHPFAQSSPAWGCSGALCPGTHDRDQVDLLDPPAQTSILAQETRPWTGGKRRKSPGTAPGTLERIARPSLSARPAGTRARDGPREPRSTLHAPSAPLVSSDEQYPKQYLRPIPFTCRVAVHGAKTSLESGGNVPREHRHAPCPHS